MARRTLVVDGDTWDVYPSGRVTVYGRDGIVQAPLQGSYRELVQEIVKFFQTGVPPVEARNATG